MTKRFLCACLAVACLSMMAGCSEEEMNPDVPQVQPEEQTRIPLNLCTRADDKVVSTAVKVGLYMQHYQDGNMVNLVSTGNYINNLMMSYSEGKWTATDPIYWADNTSLSDVYAYAPYQQEVSNCRRMKVGVPTDQSELAQLAAADLLWGASMALSPSNDNISVSLNHRFARVNVIVKPSADFAEGELKAEDLKLYINNVKCEAVMDLQTSDLTLMGETTSILTHNNGDLSFTAIVMPQSVGFVNLLRLEWNDTKCVLQHSTQFEAQRDYTFTITFKKEGASGLNVGIGGWDIDDQDYGGVVE